MGQTYQRIEPFLASWITAQPMFFVGTAPSAAEGHVNVSPKGPIGTLRLLDDHTVAYLDLIGSGAETIAHLHDNGRIVLMFCAFSGSPRILRLYGRGAVLGPGAVDFPDAPELPLEMRRAVISVSVERIADSCGYGVPLMSYEGERDNTRRWAEGKLAKGGPQALAAYTAAHNARSIDGLPALPR
ncbi:MAG: pyridoxamine 5'-phosphate oxidase family protein [Actinomycetota bacterium]|nr:pyridoxamine 5'-phosphate oxidase family protein [Actinomycetota bacterium]